MSDPHERTDVADSETAGEPRVAAFHAYPLPELERRRGRRRVAVSPALLYYDNDGEMQSTLLLTSPIRLGSETTNEIIHPELEPAHAEIDIEKDLIAVRSTGGLITVNEERVDQAVLRPGDQIRLGGTLFCLALKAHATKLDRIWQAVPGTAPPPQPESDGVVEEELRERILELRELAVRLNSAKDFEPLLEAAAEGLLEMFSALRAFCVLFEEDGKNPIFTVERYRYDNERDEEDTSAQIDEGLMAQTLRERTVVTVELAPDKHRPTPREAMAAPILYDQRALGLVYLDRSSRTESRRQVDEDLLAIVAQFLVRPIRELLGLE